MEKLLTVVFALYLLSTQVMAVVFWVAIAKVDTIFYTMTIGVLEAEVKGILWPLFI